MADYANSSDATGPSERKDKMGMDELRAMLAAEFESAMGALQASKLVTDRADALDYYFGHMQKDMPAADGRSQAISYDVADTVEGLMPSLMEIFAGSDEVVQFMPVGADDVQAAQQETDYVNHVFMNDNPGFMVLYSFLKDGLLSKVGICKIYWQKKFRYESEVYYDQTDDSFGWLQNDDDVEIVEHSERDDPHLGRLHDVKVQRKKDYSNATVVPVPPEEFVIERGARTMRDANYCCHRVIKSEAELVEMGFDAQQVRDLPVYRAYTNPEEIARDSVDEHQFYGDDVNTAARLKQVLEHYVRMDYDGSGVAKLYKVTTSGITGEVLNMSDSGGVSGRGDVLMINGEPDIVEVDEMPFAVWTPIPNTHRFWGRSVADVTMDIQRIKTAVTRGVLDSVYLALQPTAVVAEQGASDTTLDDLLVSRPNRIVRVKQAGAIEWQAPPMIAKDAFPVLEYFDTLREWRTGVNRNAQGLDANALQNQSATAVNQIYTAAQARMKLIARIAGETGIRDIFYLLHGIIRKHGQAARTFRLRGQWVSVDPRDWKRRDDLTVNVGTGTGGRAQRLMELQLIVNAQKDALAGGMTNLVTPNNLYNSAKELTKAVGHKDTDAFFTDPATQPPPQAPPNPELIKAQAQAQLEDKKIEANIATQQARMQADSALEQQKFEHQKELDMLEMGMKQREHEHNLQMASVKAATDQQSQQHQMQLAEKKAQEKPSSGTTIVAGDKGAQSLDQLAQHLAQAHEQQMQAHQHTMNALGEMLKHASSPRRIVRDKDGRVSHVETVLH